MVYLSYMLATNRAMDMCLRGSGYTTERASGRRKVLFRSVPSIQKFSYATNEDMSLYQVFPDWHLLFDDVPFSRQEDGDGGRKAPAA
jgi:hypothetical protein